MPDSPRPTRRQIAVTAAVVRWYVKLYWGTPSDVGTPMMFFDPALVGHFAVDRAQFEAGEPAALFRLLVTMAMFQRRQDQQILRILRGIRARDAHELTSSKRLLGLVDSLRCPFAKTNVLLREECGLAKLPPLNKGGCAQRPRTPCHMKRHTELLRRYGHFGKVPTSAALNIREAGYRDLRDLFDRTLRDLHSPHERARRLEGAIASSWRIHVKIANMFLSAVAVPGLCPGLRTPWSVGVDWTHFVVLDSNVDLFLSSIGYDGPATYDARRTYVQALARAVEQDMPEGTYNPRLVQQAAYLFMSYTNRRANELDCSRLAPRSCEGCPSTLTSRCALVST